MNAKLIKKTATNILIASILAIFFTTTGFAKKGGNGGGKPGGEDPPPPETSCAGYASDFPAFAYTVQNRNRKGVVGYDMFLSNADADCAVKIHTSGYKGNDLEFSYSQNGNDGVIVWRQDNNEYGGRKDADLQYDRIKMIRFQTEAEAVTSPLPLASSTVAVVTADHNSFRYIDLSADGNNIAVSVGNNDEGFTINTIREIDISGCSSDCAVSSALYSHTEFAFVGLAYSSFGDRIYFTSAFRSASTDPRANQEYVAFIEKQLVSELVSWSVPRIVTISGNGLHGNNPSYFRQPDVAIANLSDGPTEVLAFHYSQFNVQDPNTLMVLDMKTCSATPGPDADDCLSTGESSIALDVSDGRNVSFNDKVDATSMLFTTDSGIIIEHDLISGYEIVLVDGFQADSAH